MFDDPENLAIQLTRLGLVAGREYSHAGAELYMLQGVDGTDYIFTFAGERMVFSDAEQAVTCFARTIWGLK